VSHSKHITSASGLERLLACPASACLPQSADSSGEPAIKGKVVHSFLEASACVGPAEAIKHVPEEYRDLCEMIDIDALPVHLTPEVAFMFDAGAEPGDLGAELLPGSKDRDYGPTSAYDIPGTADVVGVDGNRVYIGDYKTGHGEPTPAKRNAQLLFLAYCACTVYQANSAVIEIIRVREGFDIWRDTAEVDIFALMDFADRVRTAVIEANTFILRQVVPTPREGPHCRYCRAMDSCPAKAKLGQDMGDGSLAMEIECAWAGALTAENAPGAYEKWQQMKLLTKRAGDIVTAYAKEHGIDLPDGKRFGAVTKRGSEKLDGDVVYDHVKKHRGHNAAQVAVKKTATKKSLRLALKSSLQEGEKIGAVEKKTLAVLRELGGAVRGKDKVAVEIHEVKDGS
jgi:hypothetical protein